MPRYKEVNPGLFTIITFPFLFGVMFGDIGHGFILFCFGLYLVLADERNKREKSALAVLAPARYLIILMGFFATFSGFIYNECFSFSMNIFTSCYQIQEGKNNHDMRHIDECTYYFGKTLKFCNFIFLFLKKVLILHGHVHPRK